MIQGIDIPVDEFLRTMKIMKAAGLLWFDDPAPTEQSKAQFNPSYRPRSDSKRHQQKMMNRAAGAIRPFTLMSDDQLDELLAAMERPDWFVPTTERSSTEQNSVPSGEVVTEPELSITRPPGRQEYFLEFEDGFSVGAYATDLDDLRRVIEQCGWTRHGQVYVTEIEDHTE